MSEKNYVAWGSVKTAMNNALLVYILYSMQNGTAKKIKSIICTHFAIDDIITAKDMLWDATNQSITGPKKRRRDWTMKSGKPSHMDYVVTALYQLDAADNMLDIMLNARSHPEEFNEISMADRLSRMEEQLSALTEMVDHTIRINLTLKDEMDAIQQDNHASCQFPK